MRYVLVDGMNLFFRVKFAVAAKESIDTMVGMGYHIIFKSIKSAFTKSKADKVILCMEGRSWRKSVYPEYKANRKLALAEMTQTERDNQQVLLEAYDNLCQFLDQKTNISVLHHPDAEADDLIAMWIQQHPHDEHVILSSDGDFKQLLAENVEIYNGIEETVTKLTGIYDFNGHLIYDSKTKSPKEVLDPEYFLFLKCIRGDKSDNIFSAYPGAFERKAAKNKTSIMSAFLDRNDKGYDWHNFMLHRWTDHNEVEHTVKDKYELNRQLIDLTMQPEQLKQQIKEHFALVEQKPQVTNVGIYFLQFCNKWGLVMLAKYPDDMIRILNAYKEPTHVGSEPV